MFSSLIARFQRLRWKLTWSYTWVAALTFLIIETMLVVIVLGAIGFNPQDIEFYNGIVAPVLVDDIKPITTAHLRNQPVDAPALQADLELVLGVEPQITTQSAFELDQFASVIVLDAEQNFLAATPQFSFLPSNGSFFDPALITGDESFLPYINAAYSMDRNNDQPYSKITSDALYLAFVDPLMDEDANLLGVQIATFRLPTPSSLVLIALGLIAGGLLIFSLAAAVIGTLFGWRSARKLSGRLTHLSQVSAAWGQGDFEQKIEDNDADSIGRLGSNLNQVATELQTLLKDKEQFAVLEERDRMARELHDTLAQGMSGMVLQLEAVMHHLDENEIAESQDIIAEAAAQARSALRNARAAIDDLRTSTDLAPDFSDVLQQRVDEFTRLHDIPCELNVQLSPSLRLSPTVSLHARRALREMLTNVARHANAKKVKVNAFLKENDLVIEVVDDGVGFEVDKVNRIGHYGILGMKERAQLTGGQFVIENIPQQGTKVQLRLPVEGAND